MLLAPVPSSTEAEEGVPVPSGAEAEKGVSVPGGTKAELLRGCSSVVLMLPGIGYGALVGTAGGGNAAEGEATHS